MLDKREKIRLNHEAYLDNIREFLNPDNGEFTGSITLNIFKNVIGNVKRRPENFEPAFGYEETVVVKR